MKQPCISINIEGDFIDSFIYSGTLFLVHTDSKITAHSWECLIDVALQENDQNQAAALTYEFLKDCRSDIPLMDRTPRTINIDKRQLENQKTFTLPLKGWPTDINIYANYFYIASEDGVEELKFNWQSKTLELNNRFHVWRKYAYKVSPNDGHRLAIAAGSNGIITAFPRKDYIMDEDVTTIIEIDSHDCEWIGSYLVANSLNGSFVATFPELPKKPQEKDEHYWKILNLKKREFPITKKVKHDGEYPVVYAWVAGKRIFSLLSNGMLSIEHADVIPQTEQNNNFYFPKDNEIDMGDRFSNATKILAARSGLFGTVIETGVDLYSVSENGTEVVSNRPVSWRVFPRARNYLNHLHIVENDHLSIKAYFKAPISNGGDKFGIRFEDVFENAP